MSMVKAFYPQAEIRGFLFQLHIFFAFLRSTPQKQHTRLSVAFLRYILKNRFQVPFYSIVKHLIKYPRIIN
jgi:hypothetical protein